MFTLTNLTEFKSWHLALGEHFAFSHHAHKSYVYHVILYLCKTEAEKH